MQSFLADLRRLNFSGVLNIDALDVASYSFCDYRRNGSEHPQLKGYCTLCEDQGCNNAVDQPGYRLTNISHGAHSTDFFDAAKVEPDLSTWHDQGVVFVFESPSLDYGIYDDGIHGSHAKRPAKQWYWIHSEKHVTAFPDSFSGREYGDFVWSVINTFRLSNVYITNLVKCGMNNGDGEFRNVSYFSDQCVRSCYSRFLERELKAMDAKVVFAMGNNVECWLRELGNERYFIRPLPHPAARGYRAIHYRVLYFWLVLSALNKAEILSSNDCQDLTDRFLSDLENSDA